MTTTSNSATRAWNDVNGDGIPQGDPLNPLPNGELIGPLTNPNFGKVVVATRYDDSVIHGWFKRPYNWEVTGGVQHELRPSVAVTATYIRRWYGNFTATDNLLRTAGDYDPFCVTAPLDSRLPGGGGNELCGFDDVNPAKFSATTNNLVTFNRQSEVYDGVDLTINARLKSGLLAGGVNSGRSSFDNCTHPTGTSVQPSSYLRLRRHRRREFARVLRAHAALCHADESARGVHAAARERPAQRHLQNLPGPQVLATRRRRRPRLRLAWTPALRQRCLGHRAAAAAGDLFHRPHESGRFSCVAQFLAQERRKLQFNVDLYNALNASPVTQQNNTFGPQWLRPTSILALAW